MQLQYMKYTYYTIFLFGLVEVFLNISGGPFYYVLLLLEVCALFLTLFLPIRMGLTLMGGLICVSFGPWVYVTPDSLTPKNYYNVSLFGFSIYTLTSFIFIFKIYSIRFLDGLDFRKKVWVSVNDLRLFIFFLLYLSLTILFNLKNNSFFELIYDVKVYMPVVVFWLLFSNLERLELNSILTLSLRVYIAQLFLSFIVGATFDYAHGVSYLPVSNLGMLFIVLVFTSLVSLSLFERILYVLIYFLFVYSGMLFVNGKMIVIFIMLICAIAIRYRLTSLITISIILVFPLAFNFLESEKFAILVYKLEQITSIINSGFSLKILPINSVNNIIVEFYTYYLNVLERPFSLIFGFGLGGGLYDIGDILILWKDNGAYASEFISKDNYLKFHLALIDILVKFGFFTFFFIWYVFKISKGNVFDFITIFISIFIFSTASKEMIGISILCFCYLRSCYLVKREV